MLDRFRVPTTLAKKLEDLGVPPALVLERAGLPPDLFSRDRIHVTTEEFFALYRGLEGASGDAAIGLKLGSEDRIERYDPIALAALSARSLRDALERLGRYKQLTCPEAVDLEERGDEGRVQFRWLLAEEAEPSMLIDICFAAVARIARQGSGARIRPTRVELHRTPRNRRLYETHFRCPVRLGARRNAVVFRRAELDQPFVTHNADLFAAVAPQLEAELAQAQKAKAIREQVKGVLKRLLAGRRPGIEDVAKELRLSARTLQRRLTEDGATFQQLVQDARRELARHYLLNSSLELNQTAYLLGYEDAHSFFRAFNGWEGTSPGAWRARHGSSSRPAGVASAI